jgi:hypothetical protein
MPTTQPAINPDAGAPRLTADVPCLFLAAGTYIMGPNGIIQVDRSTLITAFDDVLQVGDEVRDLTDVETGWVFLQSATVETQTTPSNPSPLYQTYILLAAEVQ